jgi:hypothetical protein
MNPASASADRSAAAVEEYEAPDVDSSDFLERTLDYMERLHDERGGRYVKEFLRAGVDASTDYVERVGMDVEEPEEVLFVPHYQRDDEEEDEVSLAAYSVRDDSVTFRRAPEDHHMLDGNLMGVAAHELRHREKYGPVRQLYNRLEEMPPMLVPSDMPPTNRTAESDTYGILMREAPERVEVILDAAEEEYEHWQEREDGLLEPVYLLKMELEQDDAIEWTREEEGLFLEAVTNLQSPNQELRESAKEYFDDRIEHAEGLSSTRRQNEMAYLDRAEDDLVTVRERRGEVSERLGDALDRERELYDVPDVDTTPVREAFAHVLTLHFEDRLDDQEYRDEFWEDRREKYDNGATLAYVGRQLCDAYDTISEASDRDEDAIIAGLMELEDDIVREGLAPVDEWTEHPRNL